MGDSTSGFPDSEVELGATTLSPGVVVGAFSRDGGWILGAVLVRMGMGGPCAAVMSGVGSMVTLSSGIM